jgi:hypothetical protein
LRQADVALAFILATALLTALGIFFSLIALI